MTAGFESDIVYVYLLNFNKYVLMQMASKCVYKNIYTLIPQQNLTIVFPVLKSIFFKEQKKDNKNVYTYKTLQATKKHSRPLC